LLISIKVFQVKNFSCSIGDYTSGPSDRRERVFIENPVHSDERSAVAVREERDPAAGGEEPGDEPAGVICSQRRKRSRPGV